MYNRTYRMSYRQATFLFARLHLSVCIIPTGPPRLHKMFRHDVCLALIASETTNAPTITGHCNFNVTACMIFSNPSSDCDTE